MIKLEEVFTLEILIKILSKIFVKGNYCITKEDINTKNCRVMIFESKLEMTNLKKNGEEEFMNMLFYFHNKNYLFFIVYCLNKKNIVYLNFFNPLLSEKESIESINLFFINNFFPHIILGLNNGKVFLYNHEGIICMQNKFVDSKIKLIFLERHKEYILLVYENNTVVNTNIYLIKRALEINSKVLPFDYCFTVNKNMSINHIFLRNANYSPEVFKKDLYCTYSRDDLTRYISDAINSQQPQFNRIANANYVITSKSITISISCLIRPNPSNDLLTKKENFGASEKLSSRINNFLKNMFTKKSDSSAAMVAASASSGGTTSPAVGPSVGSPSTALSLPSSSAASGSAGVQPTEASAIPHHSMPNTYGNTTDNLNTQVVHSFNDAKRQIIDICICPWNQNLVLALDNLGRICLFNICTLSILHMWKSYRSAFMSFIQRRKVGSRPSASVPKGGAAATGTNAAATANANANATTTVTASATATGQGESAEQLNDKAILFYLKSRNLIEIWDLKTLHKVYSVRTYEDPQLFKIFFADHDVPNKIYFFSTSHHVFLMNTNFELFHVKWPA
ncbi:Rab3 GTPase-activating protein non-catalytic subunit, putative [Plasmodium vivax]|uniref:Rab3 GTPase-activating protein non-catalytic subunit, putative n=1 Tax=Plasmodium vivax TaxID=5855 RepID=A0A1G4GWB2_PLAVI|nr:Rab3 GTPase-activating protein non-catalytic subunit, putative [Plasmodium vivax]SCO66880.1 Rab3 GTPase-activating protein non-catalytic subunit, putative [Plasmodium vivax]